MPSGTDQDATPPAILLVDDDSEVRLLLAELLSDAGYHVTESDGYSDAMRLLGTATFSVLVADLVLPDGDGRDLILEAVRLGMPAIGMSGHPGQMQQPPSPGAGRVVAPVVLAKPFQPDRLVAAVRHALGTGPSTP